LAIANRQRTCAIDATFLRQAVRALLHRHFRIRAFDLALHLVDRPEISRLNLLYLGHSGPTDVITFDYVEPSHPGELRGEIFVSVDDIRAQAPRYRTSWQSELMRCIIHGLLHLQGCDDHTATARAAMRRREDAALVALRRAHPPQRLGRIRQPPRSKPARLVRA
jgi:rRNA maturation RNase YbeY